MVQYETDASVFVAHIVVERIDVVDSRHYVLAKVSRVHVVASASLVSLVR